MYIFFLLPLNYLPLVSQCTKYSISFTSFLNIWETKIMGFFAILNIHNVEPFHQSHGGWR